MTSTGRPRASAARPNRQTGARHRTGKYARHRGHSRPAIGAQIIGVLAPWKARRTTAVLTWVASVICRRLAAGPCVHPVRLPPPHWRAVRRLARAWRGGGALQDAPSCADGAPHPSLDTGLASSGASGRTVLRHGAVRLQACEPTEQQPGRAWLALTCCTRGKSHRKTAPRTGTSASVKGAGKGTFFLVRAPGNPAPLGR
jgi:hypothetical protein